MAKEPPHRFLTVDQAADELNVSAAHVRAMLHSGVLRRIQIGGRRLWRIGRADLEHYIEDVYRKTAEKITAGELPEGGTGISLQLASALQTTENVWRSIEVEFGLLSGSEVSSAVDPAALGESFASDQRSAGNLLAVKRHGGDPYLGFQIDSGQQTIRPVMRDLLIAAKEAGRVNRAWRCGWLPLRASSMARARLTGLTTRHRSSTLPSNPSPSSGDGSQLSWSRRTPGRFSFQDGYISLRLCSASLLAASASMALATTWLQVLSPLTWLVTR